MSKLTIKSALEMSAQLESESPLLDASLLLGSVLDVDVSYLRTWPERELAEAEQARYEQLLAERKDGRPVAHILGSRGFWTLDLKTNASTLIPRPDTECLVEAVLDCIDRDRKMILDLGTGTGAIALALAKERAQWRVLASDVSADALELAMENAKINGLDNVSFSLGSWFDAVSSEQAFDVIVSNPPYIDEADPHLTEGDVRFEPLSALVAEEGGLADLRHIADQARSYLVSGGMLFMEHGYDQGDSVREMLGEFGYTDVSTIQDFGQNDRFTQGVWRN